MQPLVGQQPLREQDVLPRIGGLVLEKDGLGRHTHVQCDTSEPVRLGVLPDPPGDIAQSPGEYNDRRQTLQIKFGAPLSHAEIVAAQYKDTIRCGRDMIQMMIVPQFSGLYKYLL